MKGSCGSCRDTPFSQYSRIGSDCVRTKSLLLPGTRPGLAAFTKNLASARIVTLLATDNAEVAWIDASSYLDSHNVLKVLETRGKVAQLFSA